MNRLSTRITKLEKQTGPQETIEAVTWTIFSPSSDGVTRTGAITDFVGVDLPRMHQCVIQVDDDYDARIDNICERIQELKKLPERIKQAGLGSLATEIKNANRQ